MELDWLFSRAAVQVDASCAALAGHSYGGLTVGALTAEDPAFSCGVAIDPWWSAPGKGLHA